MSLSLIALVAFSACTDDTDGGRGTGAGGNGLSFLVSTGDTDTQTRADGNRADVTTQYLDPVELQGKLGGKSLFLQAEVTDGFPDEDQPMTRGTQVSSSAGMKAFAVSAYSDATGKPDYMYNVKVEPEKNVWKPAEEIFWPGSKKLSFYAWHPYGADNLTVTGKDAEGAPTLTYDIPTDVSEQLDLMTAVNIGQSETSTVPLTFKHVLAAVKFVTGEDLNSCKVKSVSLKNVKHKGSYTCPSDGTLADWTLDNETSNFTQTFDGGKDLDGTADAEITAADQTFFMMPQTFDDETAQMEIKLEYNGNEQTFSATMKSIVNAWTAGKTYTIRISSGAFSVELVKDRFVASGKDVVSYVKANRGWTAELLTDDDNAQTDMMTFAAGQNGVTDNTGSNDAAKLVFNTKKQSSLNGESKSVTIRFTPIGPGKPVDKTVTFWKALEAPANSDIFYAVSNPYVLTLPQITNKEQCPTGYSLPTEEVAKTISNLVADTEIAYDKTYPTLDMENSFVDRELWAFHPTSNIPDRQFFKSKELTHIKIMACGDTGYTDEEYSAAGDKGELNHLHIMAKYPYCKNGDMEEKTKIVVGSASLGGDRVKQTTGYVALVAYMYKNADNLLKDWCYFDVKGFPTATDFESCLQDFDTESYNGNSLAFLINTDQSIADRIYHAASQGAFHDVIDFTGSTYPSGNFAKAYDDFWLSFGMYADRYCCSDKDTRERLNGKLIISPTATTYYVRKLADDE